uniref:Subtilisin-like protease n=3 Tax=Aegilops tauschii subsp. strangulata TaxID=200361 RepID=A0A453DN61_AEGTS
MGFSSSSRRSRIASVLQLCLCMLLCRVQGGSSHEQHLEEGMNTLIAPSCSARDSLDKDFHPNCWDQPTKTSTAKREPSSYELYIVYLGEVKHDHPDHVVASHHDMLTTLLGSKEESIASVAYNYKHGFSGFAAMLTPEQAKQLAEVPEVISVEKNKIHTTATTRSWDFLGLNYQMTGTSSGLLKGSNYGEDVIIGVVDTGIWPESRSFSDEGYGPIPSRWKGKCQLGPDWGSNNCTRKIIGARFYTAGVLDKHLKADTLSPRDRNGHGTHCASTAAGSIVEAASFNGLAEGVARGGAPRARIAVYKSGWGSGSFSTASVLAAIDDAIHDGVDVLSLSIGGRGQVAFGALHAVQKGITVVYAAGNDGPRPQTVGNISPWVITVAASKVDRSFPTVITLGNKQQIVGQSLYYQAKNSSGSSFAGLLVGQGCTADTLNGTDVRGIILFCLPLPDDARTPVSTFEYASQYVRNGGGSGLIFAQYTTDLLTVTASVACQGIACVLVDLDTGEKIIKYVGAASSPVAKIEPAHTVTGKEIPEAKVASFSSRGPSRDYADIIKPDIAAPGANILAAVGDSYVMYSGTSMAAPHVAGIVALLKAEHPDWSPAAIKSAIMTTARVTDKRGMPILAEGLPRKTADPFDYGSGNINPTGAADPGLVYDIDPRDYNKFFGCTIVRRTNVSCDATMLPAYHLNLPSIAVSELRRPVTVWRTVTNVGEADSVYHAEVQSPAGVMMEVEPTVLVFNTTDRVHSFKVKLAPMWRLQGDYTFGSITWRKDQKTILKDEETREKYDYAVAHPEEFFYNTAQYYRAYYGYKTDTRSVLIGLLLIVSAFQYINQLTSYSQAIESVKQTPAYRNRLKALEFERTGGISSKKKGNKPMDKKVEDELRNEVDLQIQGVQKPSVWNLCGVQLILLPYLIGKLLIWQICWFWRYRVKKSPYAWEDACYLTRTSLRMPANTWQNIDEFTKEDLVMKRLWEKANMERHIAEARRGSKQRRR